MPPLSPNQKKARAVRLLCLDVDGTLTDGRLITTAAGYSRAYHVFDGFGVQQFIQTGGVVAIVSAASEGLAEVTDRARQMGAHHILLQLHDKLEAVRDLIAAENLTAEQTAFAGDDFFDVPALQHVGFACVPRGAHASARAVADYITRAPGGEGAVREICDFILSARAAAQ